MIFHGGHNAAEQRLQPERRPAQLHLARLDLGEIKDIADDFKKVFG